MTSATYSRIASMLIVSLLGATAYSQEQQHQISKSKRHVVILQPSEDQIWGSYIFAVDNPSKKPQLMQIAVMIPKETKDFKAQEGIEANELKLGSDGGLIVEKLFPPGNTLLGVGFLVESSLGKATLTFDMREAIDQMVVLIPQDSISAVSEFMNLEVGVPFAGQVFNTLTVRQPTVGKTYVVHVDGVHEGRGRLWLIGAIFAALLFISAAALAYKTRPKLSGVDSFDAG
jgi:hypothetical protein